MISRKTVFILFVLLGSAAITLGITFLSVEARNNSLQTEGDNHVYIPLMIQGPWINPFGYESNVWVTDTIYEQRAADLGGSWARMNGQISWRELQPEEGGPIEWDLLSGFEEELRTYKELGIHPIVVVDNFPRWATIEPNSCSPLKEDKFDDYADFIEELVHHFKESEFNVHNWELGNEVDIDRSLIPVDSVYGCWGDISDLDYYGGEYYGEMVKIVGKRIKSADPDARVWLGGLILSVPETTDPSKGKPENFLRGVLAVGAAPFFDVVPYHGHIAYYGNMKDSDSLLIGNWAPWGGAAVGKPRFLRSIMQEYGVDKILSLNEVGVGCIDDIEDEHPYCKPPTSEFYQFQANRAIRYAVRVLSENVESYIWYTLNSPSWRNMGLVYDDKSERPVFYAYQNLISRTQGLTYSNLVDLGEGIEAHQFVGNQTRLVIAWTDINELKTISISPQNFKAAFDRDGKEIIVGDNFDVTIGFAPIYLEYYR